MTNKATTKLMFFRFSAFSGTEWWDYFEGVGDCRGRVVTTSTRQHLVAATPALASNLAWSLVEIGPFVKFQSIMVSSSKLRIWRILLQDFSAFKTTCVTGATFVELQVFKVWSPVHQATSLEDYHRVHSPVDGTIVSIRGYEKDELFPGAVVWLL